MCSGPDSFTSERPGLRGGIDMPAPSEGRQKEKERGHQNVTIKRGFIWRIIQAVKVTKLWKNQQTAADK